jgi:hypothetical protein
MGLKLTNSPEAALNNVIRFRASEAYKTENSSVKFNINYLISNCSTVVNISRVHLFESALKSVTSSAGFLQRQEELDQIATRTFEIANA